VGAWCVDRALFCKRNDDIGKSLVFLLDDVIVSVLDVLVSVRPVDVFML
jgi:hypothetical protein